MLTEKFELIEILGQKALFTEERLKKSELPVGLFAYDLRESNNWDEFSFGSIEPNVYVNHAGSIICLNKIDFGTDGFIEFTDQNEEDYPNFLGEEISLEDFVKSSEEYTSVAKDKKANMAYWDAIDYYAEEYIQHIADMGYLGKVLTDNDKLEIGKKITEKAVEILKNQYGYEFPYVNENY